MVQKSKGGKKSRSVLSGKRKKTQNKNYSKDNYKKKPIIKVECSVCYEMILDNSDNVVTCGKINHPLCEECKLKIGNDDCPMCRSHKVPLPRSQLTHLRIMKSHMKA